jgi:hypothetical protein
MGFDTSLFASGWASLICFHGHALPAEGLGAGGAAPRHRLDG